MSSNADTLKYGILLRNIELEYKENITNLNPDPAYKIIILALENEAKNRDLYSLYEIEKVFLEQEKLTTPLTKLKTSSLNNALIQLTYAKEALDAVQNKETYIQAAKTYSKDTKDSKGLPHDAIRLYIKSQTARLLNLEKGVETKEQAEILKARSNCLRTFKSAYIEKQAQQLDIDLKPPPSTTKEQPIEDTSSVSDAEDKSPEVTPKKRRRMG